jgi:hypothetical protein
VATGSDSLLKDVRERLREFGISFTIVEPQDTQTRDAGATVLLKGTKTAAQYAMVALEPVTVSSLAHAVPRMPSSPLLVVGNRITRRSAAGFRDAGIQFVDAAGNAYISFDGVLIDVQGRTGSTTPVRERRHSGTTATQSANVFSALRSQVVLAILAWPELSAATVRDIAKAAGVSVGTAHDALLRLEQAGLTVPSSRRLDRADDLLDYWTAAYPSGLGRKLEVASYHGDPARPLAALEATSPAYLSSESAEGSGIARPATLTVYLSALAPKLPIANRWSAGPDRAANIFVRRKFWTSPRAADEEPSTEPRNAPWPLVYADLLATGDARLAEVARVWRTRHARSE